MVIPKGRRRQIVCVNSQIAGNKIIISAVALTSSQTKLESEKKLTSDDNTV